MFQKELETFVYSFAFSKCQGFNEMRHSEISAQEPGVAGCLVEQEAADVGPDSSKARRSSGWGLRVVGCVF